MKICHITTAHESLDTRIFIRECSSLAKAGYEVHLLANHPRSETINGVQIDPLPKKLSGWGRRLYQAYCAFKEAKNLKADLYHFHDPELLPFMSLLAKRKYVIWDVHELYYANIIQHNRFRWPLLNSLIAKVFDKLEFYWCRNFAGIIAATPQIRKRYEHLKLNLILLLNVADLESIPPPEDNPAENSSYVLASGNMYGRQVDKLLQGFALAVKKCNTLKLCVIPVYGNIQQEMEIRNLVERLGLDNYVKFIKPLPWVEFMSKILPAARLGIVFYEKTPNNLAGIPNRLFEYWAGRIPVLVTDTPNLSQIVSDWGGGTVVDSTSSQAIAQGLVPYLRDPIFAKKMGEQGRAAVEKRFNWAIEQKELMNLYSKIIKNRS